MSQLRRVVISVFAGNLTVAGLAFLFQVLLTRTLSVPDFGRVSLILSLVAIVQTVVVFGFPGSAVVYYGKCGNKQKAMADLNGWFLVSLMVVLVLMIPATWIMARVFHLTFLEHLALLGAVIGLNVYTYAVTRRQKQGLWTQYNRGLILNAVLRLGLGFGAAFLYASFRNQPLAIHHVLWGYFGWSVALVLLGLLDIARWTGLTMPWHLPGTERRAFLHILVNLGLTDTFAIISLRAANLIIEREMGAEALAIFAAANTLALIMPVLTTSMMRVFIREAAQDGTQMLVKIFHLQKKYALWVVGASVVGLAVAKPLILIVFGDRYAASADIFRLLMMMHIGGVVFTPLESYFYANRQNFVMRLKALHTVLVILGTLAAMQFGGLSSVAWALILARVLGWAILVIRARTLVRVATEGGGP